MQFEQFKAGQNLDVPGLPFMLLSALPLSRKDWVSVAKNASWQTTRMNLNTFARHGVFEVDGMAEMVEEGVTGLLVPGGNIEALSDRMVELLNSPKRCAEMGEAGRARVREKFLWTQVVDRIEAGLRNACANR